MPIFPMAPGVVQSPCDAHGVPNSKEFGEQPVLQIRIVVVSDRRERCELEWKRRGRFLLECTQIQLLFKTLCHPRERNLLSVSCQRATCGDPNQFRISGLGFSVVMSLLLSSLSFAALQKSEVCLLSASLSL